MNILLRSILPVIVMLVLNSCCVISRNVKVEEARLSETDSKAVLERFSVTLPSEYKLINSVIFKYRGRVMPALGYIEVDEKNDEFSIHCMTPVGMKLFEFISKKQEIGERYVFAGIADKGDIVQAVADDVRRVYFNRIPGAGAEAYMRSKRIVFRQPHDKGSMEYVFNDEGDTVLLIEKQYFEKKRPVWRVRYSEYSTKDGMRYPAGIKLEHYRYKYSLDINLKEVRL